MGCPNIQGGIWGHPNVQGAMQTYGGHPSTHGASQMYGAYGHPLSLTKHAFFVLCRYRRHPNIWGAKPFFVQSWTISAILFFFFNFKYFIHFSKYSFEFCTVFWQEQPAARCLIYCLIFLLKIWRSFLLKNFYLKSDENLILNIKMFDSLVCQGYTCFSESISSQRCILDQVEGSQQNC